MEKKFWLYLFALIFLIIFISGFVYDSRIIGTLIMAFVFVVIFVGILLFFGFKFAKK